MQGRSLQVARGLQTISARIVKYKGALAEYGITVEKGNGALKSTFEILTELKPKWDAMSDAERVALGDTLAGTNQFKVLASVMTNFQTALNANTTALNSENSAMEENEKYMSGIEAGGQRLAATFEQLATKVISSELITALQNLATTILELVNNPIGRFIIQWGLLTGVLIGAITIFGTIITKIGAMIAAMTAMGGAIAGVASVAAPLAVGLGFLATVLWTVYDIVQKTDYSFEELTDSIKTTNEQLESNRARLSELNQIGWADRSYEIQLEIDKLKAENAELEENLKLLKQEQYEKAKKNASGRISVKQREVTAYGGYMDYSINEYIELSAVGKDAANALENLNKVLDTTNRSVETVNYTTGKFVSTQEDATYAYKFFNRVLTGAIEELKYAGKVSDETQRIIGENAIVLKELISWYELLGDDAPRDLQIVANAFYKYNNAMNDARKYGTGLVAEVSKQAIAQWELAEAENSATTELLKLIAQEKIFNNTELSVKQQIEALAKLALAAGYTTEAVYGALGASLNAENSRYFSNDPSRVLRSATHNFNALLDGGVVENNNDDNGNGTGTAPDRIKQAAEAEYKLAQHYLNMGWRDEKWYYDEIERIANTYYLNVAGYEYDYWKLEEEFTKGRIKLAEQEEERKEAALKEFHEKVQEFLEKREKEMQRQFDLLDHNLAMEYINEDEYYTQLQALAEKYYKGNEKYLSEWESVQERIHEHQVKVAVEGLEYLDKKFQEQIDLFNDYENKINDLYDDEKKKLEDTNAELEKKIEYEKLLDNLAKARAQRRLVYKDGAFQYVQDVGAISSAQLAIDEFNRKQEATAKSAALDRGRAKSLAMNTANKDNAILARMAENSAKWHTVSPQEQETLHQQNENLASQLSSNARRRYDDITGVWSAYADGTINANGGLSLVGEHGAELRVLNSGDGILPADITKNLFAWGKVSPTSVISNLIDRASASNTITIGNISLPSVTNAQEFVSGLKNIAYQYAYQRGV